MLFITYLELKNIDNLSNTILTKKEVIDKINNFLKYEFQVDESKIKPEANLKSTLGLGSLDYIDLIVLTEQNFDFTAQKEDFLHIKTFHDFYEYCYSHVPKKK